MRRSGVPLQRDRPALEQLDAQFGLAHALASRRLYTDGAEVLFDYAEAAPIPGWSARPADWSWFATGSACSTPSWPPTCNACSSTPTATCG